MDLHALLRLFAESRVRTSGRARGWEGGSEELGVVMGEVRRAASVAVVRGQAKCLLERLAYLGPGGAGAEKRKEATLRLEEGRRRERQAYQLAHFSWGLGRVGLAFVP